MDAADAEEWSCQYPSHEEFHIFDWDGMRLPEMSPAEAAEIGRQVDKLLGEYPFEAVAAYIQHDRYADLGDFPNAYQGEWESFQDYAYKFMMDRYPDLARVEGTWPYLLDWEAIARDLSFEYWEAPARPYGVYVFHAV